MTDSQTANIFELPDCPFKVEIREPCRESPTINMISSRFHLLTRTLIKLAIKIGNVSAWVSDSGEKGKFESDSLNDAYFDRNQAVMLAASFAEQLGDGLCSGWKENPDDPDWPILYINLPIEGQVSWHIPKAERVDFGCGTWYAEWDGHDLAEKRKRIDHYLKDW